MKDFRKPPTKNEFIERLSRDQLDLPPLRFEIKKIEPIAPNNRRFDFEIDVAWEDQWATFLAEYKATSTPKAFEEAIRFFREVKLPPNQLPMVVMPYLRESQLNELEKCKISGLDLSGNGVVIVPGKLLVFRTGAKNQFSSYSPIKNVYRKNTSMVARAFLVKQFFRVVQDIRDEVNRRNPLVERWGKTAMSLGTVSKALKGLEDDLIIDRRDGVRLLQPSKLLKFLGDNYEKPRITKVLKMKIDINSQDLPRFVCDKAEQAGIPVVATGLGSVGRYASMQREDKLSVYCPRISLLLENIPGREEKRFPNFELFETEEQPIFFDAREENGFFWSSPVQTYLELATGDKRDRETAEQIESFILKDTEGAFQ